MGCPQETGDPWSREGERQRETTYPAGLTAHSLHFTTKWLRTVSTTYTQLHVQNSVYSVYVTMYIDCRLWITSIQRSIVNAENQFILYLSIAHCPSDWMFNLLHMIAIVHCKRSFVEQTIKVSTNVP